MDGTVPVTGAEGLGAISTRIWDMKYRLKQPDGTPVDGDVAATWDRVATALSRREAPECRDHWRDAYLDILDGFQFLPAGRIIAGAGTNRAVTLFNCFVMGTLDDSIDGIFAGLREAAMTLQQGGGIGYDFSTLRPKGAPVRGVGADASGPLSFMDVWDAMCRTIMSAGARRGAMMATLRCDHPDIEAFIASKRTPERLRMFNLSVLVTDAFMAAVEADRDWPLVFGGEAYKTVRARSLWDAIMRATYDYAEPGVIFIDRINQANNLAYCETIAATNPCGEQPLPPYGACLLGSVNLARLVTDPFEPGAALDEARLDHVVTTAVRLMDAVIDQSRYPLDDQAREAAAKRRIGLGVTGLADAFLQVGVRYGGAEAVALTDRWLQRIQNTAYRASALLAREKGVFPLYDREAFLARPMIAKLDADVRELIARHGVRNALVTSIAPTGTISLLADNVSSGIEPVFAFTYTRTVLLADGSKRSEEVSDYAWRLFRRLKGPAAPLPDAFVDARSLAPSDHVAIQAAAQTWVDSAISKTVNCPEDMPFEAFQSVYWEAYRKGCKGCTTYRPNPITGAVLEAADRPAPQAPDTAGDGSSEPLARPEALPGRTYKLKWPDSDHAIYVTLNDIVQDGHRRPFEIFINSKNMEHYAWTVALTRMISAVFRRGGDVSFVVEELKAVFDPRGGQWINRRYVPSLLAAIGGTIETHLIDIGFIGPERAGVVTDDPGAIAITEAGPDPAARPGPPGRPCPRCGSPSLVRIEGCDTCQACGFSRCG